NVQRTLLVERCGEGGCSKSDRKEMSSDAEASRGSSSWFVHGLHCFRGAGGGERRSEVLPVPRASDGHQHHGYGAGRGGRSGHASASVRVFRPEPREPVSTKIQNRPAARAGCSGGRPVSPRWSSAAIDDV